MSRPRKWAVEPMEEIQAVWSAARPFAGGSGWLKRIQRQSLSARTTRLCPVRPILSDHDATRPETSPCRLEFGEWFRSYEWGVISPKGAEIPLFGGAIEVQ